MKESEETEVKDNEWLKEHITIILGGKVKYKDKNVVDDKYFVGLNNAYVAVLEMLESLDVETLTPEWIDELIHYSTDQDAFGNIVRIEMVPAKYLRNLLVPKQELPVIPKFVANWIERNQEDDLSDTIHFIIYGLYANWPDTNSMVKLRKPVVNWIGEDRDNYFKLIDATRHGYTIEELPKYFAKIKGHENISSDDKYWNYCITDESLDIGDNKVHADVLAEYVLNTTKDEWENLGINDDNAEFVEAEEFEE